MHDIDTHIALSNGSDGWWYRLRTGDTFHPPPERRWKTAAAALHAALQQLHAVTPALKRSRRQPGKAAPNP